MRSAFLPAILRKLQRRMVCTPNKMSLGGLSIKVENDRYTHVGRYGLKIHDCSGGTVMTMLFHPETLNRDFGAEDAEKCDAAQRTRREWVQSHGPDYCHKMVDRYWNG